MRRETRRLGLAIAVAVLAWVALRLAADRAASVAIATLVGLFGYLSRDGG